MAETGRTSRRAFLGRAAAVPLADGTLALVDQLAGGITRAAAATTTAGHDEQYLVDGLEAITDNGVTVVIPPLYKYIITARLRRDRTWNAVNLKAAQTQLESALQRVEQGRTRNAAGLTVVVAWGLPYFTGFVKPAASASTWSGVWPLDTSGGTTKDAVLENRLPFTSFSVASESLRNMNMTSLDSRTSPDGSLGKATASSTASFVVPPEVSRGQTADQADADAEGFTKPVK